MELDRRRLEASVFEKFAGGGMSIPKPKRLRYGIYSSTFNIPYLYGI